MKQVWKFELPMNEDPTHMPEDAEVLSVAFQGDTLVLWALVDIDAGPKSRQFIVRGTGHNIRSDNVYFIGTAFTGSLVFHVFEVL